jgi:hypothetical protein
MNYGYSTETRGIDAASNELIIENSEHLIAYIYSNKEKMRYSDPEIRIGLSLKILLKTEKCFERDLLLPIIEDIEYLLSNKGYLSLFNNPELRKEGLSKELMLVNKYIELSDTITLNRLDA